MGKKRCDEIPKASQALRDFGLEFALGSLTAGCENDGGLVED